jgi:hypothetical protein
VLVPGKYFYPGLMFVAKARTLPKRGAAERKRGAAERKRGGAERLAPAFLANVRLGKKNVVSVTK